MTKTPKAKARKVRAVPHEEALAQFRKRPGYQAAYDAFEEEFSIISALIFESIATLIDREADGRTFRLIGVGVGDLGSATAADPADLFTFVQHSVGTADAK